MKKILSFILIFSVALSCVISVMTSVYATNEVYPELIINGDFELGSSDEVFEWKARDNGNCAISQVDEGVSGYALKAKRKLERGGLDVRTSSKINLEYFKTYTLTYSAKAADEKLVGKKVYAYIRPIEVGTTHPVLPNAIEIHPVGTDTLSTEWQTYTATIYLEYLTDTNVSTELFLRADSSAIDDSFLIDNVSLKQGETYRADISFMVQMALSNESDDYVLVPQYTTSVGGYSYSVKSGESVLRQGNNDEGVIVLPKAWFEDDTIYLEYVGWDAHGNETEQNKVKLVDLVKMPSIAQDSYATIQNDNCFWSRGGDEVFARFYFENVDESKTVYLIAAQYDKNKKLIEAKLSEILVTKGETVSEKLTLEAKDEAVNARFFAIEAKTCKPLTDVISIDKVTSGQFIYVDAVAKDGGDGSAEKPFNNIADAQNALDNVMKSRNTEPVYVVFSEGEYFTSEPLYVGVPENYKMGGALSNATVSDYYIQKPVTFTTAGDDKAVISGGMHLSGFSYWRDGIYRAPVPKGTQTRQLFVNGIKATRARTEEDPVGFENLDSGAADFANNGLTSTDVTYLAMDYPDEVELVFIENWRHMYIRPDSVTNKNGKVHFGFGDNAPVWMAMMTCNTPPTLPVYLENSLTFLDKEGEWYLDAHENYIYYKPRSFENIENADVVVPVAEKLLSFVGTPGTPVRDVSVNNLEFAYSTWSVPTEERHFHVQQNTALYGGTTKYGYTYTGIKQADGGNLIGAAVEMKNINTVSIDNCVFAHLGATALKMTGAVQNSNVIGNEFYDVSASGIALGNVIPKTDPNKAEEVVKDTVDILWDLRNPKYEYLKIKDNVISDNYIHKVGTDYYSSAALSTGYVVDTIIKNNEFAEGHYSGMHLGWGWNSYQDVCTEGLAVENNYIHDFMDWRLHDGAAIYTLGWSKNNSGEKHSTINENYVTNVDNRWGGIYFDEGSRYWQCISNVIDVTSGNTAYSSYRETSVPQRNKWLNVWTKSIAYIEVKNNYPTTSVMTNKGNDVTVADTTVCPGGLWDDNALDIISKSGVSPVYKSRFDFKEEYLRVPHMMEIKVGETADISVDCRVLPNEKQLDLTNYVLSVSSNNEAIVDVDNVGSKIEGVAEGMAWVTLTLNPKNVTDAIAYYDKKTFCVYVKQ